MAYHFSNTLASTLNSLAHTLLAESELCIYPLFFSLYFYTRAAFLEKVIQQEGLVSL